LTAARRRGPSNDVIASRAEGIDALNRIDAAAYRRRYFIY
jgi:hypothetical protein